MLDPEGFVWMRVFLHECQENRRNVMFVKPLNTHGLPLNTSHTHNNSQVLSLLFFGSCSVPVGLLLD